MSLDINSEPDRMVLENKGTNMTPTEATLVIRKLLELDGYVPDKVIARSIGTNLFDVPTIFSGMVSSALIGPDGFRSKRVCEDHRMGRNRAGYAFLAAHRAGTLTEEAFILLLDEARTVNYITSEENRALVPFQKRIDSNYQDDYSQIGLTLIPDPRPAPRWFYRTYSIGNQTYSNINEAMRATRVPAAEIRRRCASKARMWSTWSAR